MGLYDREYLRDDEPRYGAQSGGRMMVTNLVILNAALFLLDLFLGSEHWLMHSLSVNPTVLVKPWLWWKLLTYGFAHSPGAISHVFWNMFGLWIFGRDVESIYGRKEFLRVYLTVIVLGGLVWCLKEYFVLGSTSPNTILWGASGAVTAVVLLYVFHFPNRTILLMMVLPVPAWVVGLLIIGGDLLQIAALSQNSSQVAFDVHLVGAAFAIAYFRFGWNLGRWFPSGLSARNWIPKRQPKLRVHNPNASHSKQDEEADRLLDKVNEQGLDSLSPKERKALDEYSRRMRQKHS